MQRRHRCVCAGSGWTTRSRALCSCGQRFGAAGGATGLGGGPERSRALWSAPPVQGPRASSGVIPEGGQAGRVRPASGSGAGIHGIRGASGDVRVRGPGFPSDLRPRAPPLAPLVHPPGAGGLWGNEIWFGRRSGRSAAGTVLGGGGRGEGRLWRVDRDLSSPLIPPPGRFARTTPPSSCDQRHLRSLLGSRLGP